MFLIPQFTALITNQPVRAALHCPGLACPEAGVLRNILESAGQQVLSEPELGQD